MKGFGLDYFFGIFDGLRGLRRVQKNNFSKFSIYTFIKIEIELIINFIKYCLNFINRHI